MALREAQLDGQAHHSGRRSRPGQAGDFSPVLLCGHNELGVVSFSFSTEVGQATGCVSVMIVEGSLAHHPAALTPQGDGKCIGISQATEGEHLPALDRLEADLASVQGRQADRRMDGLGQEQIGIHLSAPPLNVPHLDVRDQIAAGNHDGMGAAQRTDGFSEQPCRQEPGVAEGQRRIDGHNVKIACQTPMLKAVVHHEDLGVSAADGLCRSGHTVRIDDHRCSGASGGELRRFVAARSDTARCFLGRP